MLKMKIRNFVAADIDNALTQISTEIGPSALILEIRRSEEKGLKGLLGKKFINVTAAYTEEVVDDTFGSVLNDVLSSNGIRGVDKDNQYCRKPATADPKISSKMFLLLNESKKRGINVEVEDKDESDAAFDSLMTERETYGFDDLRKPVRNNYEFGSFMQKNGASAVEDMNKPKRTNKRFASFMSESGAHGFEDWQRPERINDETKKSVDRATVSCLSLNAELEKVRLHLNGQHVKDAITDSLLNRWESLPMQKQESLNVKSIRSDVRNRIANLISVKDILGNQIETDNKKVITFVGPTGVGKTTTLAKVAAKLVLNDNKSVGVITIDTYKIAAVEQLTSFAEMIDIPVSVAKTSEELLAAVDNFKDKDFILIDTVGRSQYDDEKIKILMEVLESLPLLEIYLVVGAGTRHKDAVDIFNSFSIMPIKGFVFTKIDETKYFGTMLNVSETTKLPICCLTNGQEVPDDILAPDPKWIARLIVPS